MANEIAEYQIPGTLVAKTKFADDATHERMSGTGYLPRIQLMASTSKLVAKGLTKLGSYVLVNGKDTVIQDFGNQFSAMVITWRPKALDFSGGKLKSFFNPAKEGFKNCEKKADAKVRNFAYGPEYLIYIPEPDMVATFHFNNLSARMRAGEMKALLGKAGTFKSEVIEKDGNIWPAPIVSVCSTPLKMPKIGEPGSEEFFARLQEQVDKFANPPDEEVEEVEEAAAAPAEGRQR